jgi:hypothetical protein
VPRFAIAAKLTVLFTLLTAVMTWPQAVTLTTSAHDHQDVYFNMWRIAWVAHALATSPGRMFDGNIFHPEPRTLTLSDAMPVEALLAAPLLWSGAPPMFVHNVMLLAGIVLSAVGIAVLARSLTGSLAAGVTAGVVFAFVPYRFEHYMHMELQWTVWVPWAFWALHRTIQSGSPKFGLLMGAFMALQFMSSIYYGIFLATLAGLVVVLLLCNVPPARLKRAVGVLAIGGTLAAVLVAPYAMPYLATKRQVGGRGEHQLLMFSARPSNYTVATDGNLLYGDRSKPRGRLERRLFPGILAALLAVVGLLLRPPSAVAIAYLLALAAAFELSLGVYGYSYSFLYRHVPAFDALRAPARLGIFVVFFLAVLAAWGHAALGAALSRAGRYALAVAIWAVLLLEYWVAPLALTPYLNEPPPLYAWLAQQPRGLVAEFPLPLPQTLPGDDARYAYMSTFHWMPMVNGYSGYYPRSYITRLVRLRGFPNATSVERLRHEGVHYLIVHQSGYSPGRALSVVTALLTNPSLKHLGHFSDGRGVAVVFRVVR